MIRPRFSIRVFLLAAALLGFVCIPFGHRQYLKWREQTSQLRRRIEVIRVANSDAEEIAAVLRAVYFDRIQNGNARESQQPFVDPLRIVVDASSNSVIISGPKDLFSEIRELIRAIDTASTTEDMVFGPVKPNPKMIEGALRRLLDASGNSTP